MRQIQNDLLRQFFEGLRFAPLAQKEKELTRAEALLEIVEPDKEYPFEFVCFRIAGFRPRSDDSAHIVRGGDLIEALNVFIAMVNRQTAPGISTRTEKVYTVRQLALRFDVSSKTIHRWRAKGLRSRLFVFEDGRKRLGFVGSAVERFVKGNERLVKCAGDFGHLTAEEKNRILKQAVVLAQAGGRSRHGIIKQIAGESGRAVETIRSLLAAYDKNGKNGSTFRNSPGRVHARDIKQICRLHSQGVSIAELMRKFDRSRSSIYRIINKRRVTELLGRKITYVDSPDFQASTAAESILSDAGLLESADTDGAAKGLLTRQREIELFRRYNYVKFCACRLLEKVAGRHCHSRDIRGIESYLTLAEQLKKVIIEANLRLVASIAGKHAATGEGFADLIGEGNISLMRAVEKFDYTRGYRFSTYATWAIAKDFAKKIPAEARRPDRGAAGDMVHIQQDLRISGLVDFAALERVGHSLQQVITDNLTDREQYIIRNHYALEAGPIRRKPKTLKQIGAELNLSSERIRQIELVALQKLRQNLSPEQFDLLTG